MSPEFVIARLETSGHKFEVLVKPEAAWEYKNAKKGNIGDILVSEEVFKDSSKGLRAPEALLKEVFGTTNIHTIAETIMAKGELQLTAQQRHEMTENMKKQVVNYIAKHCVDPKSGLPHPPTRIELALQQVRYSVSPFRGMEEQALEAIKALRTVIPLKMAVSVLEVRVPATYRKSYGQFIQVGEVKSTVWGQDGSFTLLIEAPSGMKPEIVERVKTLSRGQAEIREAGQKSV